MRIPKTMILPAVWLFVFCACHGVSPSEAKASHARDDADPLIARVGGQRITAADLKAKIDQEPTFLRTRLATPRARKQILDQIIRFRVLVSEARKEKLDQDPTVRATLERLMVQRLLKKKSDEISKEPLGDAELRTYYKDHLSDFVHPERLRVAQIFLAAPPNGRARAQVKMKADHLLVRARKDPSTFAALARKRSDDVSSKAVGGDLGLETRAQLASREGKALAEAAFSMKHPGELSEVATPSGFHLLKLVMRVAGTTESFASARPVLESRLRREMRAHGIDSYVASLRKAAQVTIDEKALDALKPSSLVASEKKSGRSQ